ncbi:PPOX class F420-dependent oxidoreductase [Longivirga aurantiaca]|uniref:PPOX class F420-dependent oxidoreductase n=1 Tax=Longivirga aurantiaca TaxID=1837743 RepID=A0ABW1T4S0_9ACTN
MTATMSDAARELFAHREYVTLATIEADGQPHLSVVWATLDGDDILVSTVEGRRKHVNLVRDPRATVLLMPHGRPWIYLEVRGHVTMTREGGRELIETLSRKYTQDDRYSFDDGTDNVRVVVRITPYKVIEYDGLA